MKHYQLNFPDVSAELFDNEILAINLKSGYYHSLRYSAVPFWIIITSGFSFEFAIKEISKNYSVEERIISQDLTLFIEELVLNNLVIESAENVMPTIDSFEQYCIGKYEKPLLENYTDMKDLLLLDPIHEVDITGWPKKSNHSNTN